MKQLLRHSIGRYSGTLILLPCLLFSMLTFAQPANDACVNAITLTSGTACVNVGGDMALSGPEAPALCAGTNRYDVWYRFLAQSVNPTITLSSVGANFLNPRIQVFSGTCGSLTSVGCSAGLTITPALTAGQVYYIRVYSATLPVPVALATFNICIDDPAVPANDLCAGALNLTVGAAAIAGNMFNASQKQVVSGDCGSTPFSWDVWYTFTAATRYPTIVFASLGAELAASQLTVQLFSGACGALTSLGCDTTQTNWHIAQKVAGPGLTIGQVYRIRVSHRGTTMTGVLADWSYTIRVRDQVAQDGVAPQVDFGKSYINVTKQTTGGTIQPGDELEIRATFVVRTNTIAYNVAFNDVIPTNTTYVPNSLSILTNEGKVYKQWTDGLDGDPAYISGSNITINMGLGAIETHGGTVRARDRPSNFNATCIMVAAYRVIVTGGYGNTIPVGGGTIAYMSGLGVNTSVNFPLVNAMIYDNSGICLNTVGTNAIISESAGTFGSGTTKDRAASPKVPGNYGYVPFNTGAPQDYFYGISNNTSANTGAGYSINPNEPLTTKRVHGVWDITGDHTGAADPLAGNAAADVNNGATGGYMVVINAAYKTDTAFLDTISNLCPNTSYEYAAWFKNVCRKCGNDSAGRGPSAVGYVPTALGDSSGVRPTLTFNINGRDYYSTGDIVHTNQWMKKGFVYRTGAAETQMIISVRNNAPGGGGNDWAIDDIGVSTCSPNLVVNPGAPIVNVCYGDGVSLEGDVTAYFNNYAEFVWEISTNGGGSWSSSGFEGPGTPTFNGTEYVYTATGPSFIGDSTTHNNLYRLKVASTGANLVDPSCSFIASSMVQVMVDNCSWVLRSDVISTTGTLMNSFAKIEWNTVNETDKISYEIEKSFDGNSFTGIGIVKATAINGSGSYSFNDPQALAAPAYYRIKLLEGTRYKYSKVILLTPGALKYDLKGVVNPFTSEVKFEAIAPQEGVIKITITDNFGRRVRTTSERVTKGLNSIRVTNLSALTPGIYSLQTELNGQTLVKRILKINK